MRTYFCKVFVSAFLALAITACVTKQDTAKDIVVTLLFTNDIESAYEPVPAWWREDMEHIGGIAQLTTLIKLK